MKIYHVNLSKEEKDKINKEFRERIFEEKISMERVKEEINEIIENKSPKKYTKEEIEKRKEELEEEEIKKRLNLNYYRRKDYLNLTSFEDDEKSKHIYTLTVTEYYNKARSLENKKSTERAIIVYEKIINEYKYGGENPYQRLRHYYNKQKRFDDVIRICDLQMENIGNIGYLNGKNLMIKKEDISEDNFNLKAIKNIKKEAEIKLKAIEEEKVKNKEKTIKEAKYKDNAEIKLIREEREKEKAKLIKERNHELNEVRNRYAGEYRAIELERSQMKNNVDSIKIPKYDSEISSRKINEYTIQIPKRVRTNTAFKSALLAGLTGVWAYEEREETKWFLDKMTLYEDGIKINKKISFGDITENSYDEKNGLYYFLIRTHADEIIFNTTNKQVLNDLNDAIGNYHLKIRNRIINERNEEIYKKERSLSNKNLNRLNSREKDTKKRQKMEEDTIYKNYREKLHDVNRKYEKMRKEKLEELIEEDELKDKKEIESKQKEIEERNEIIRKDENEIKYQNYMTSQGINIPSYSTPYDFEDEEGLEVEKTTEKESEEIIQREEKEQDKKDLNIKEYEHSSDSDEEYERLKEIYAEKIKETKEVKVEGAKDKDLNETENMHITSSDNLVLKPFKESLDIEENVKAMQKYDETVLSYNDEGKMLEKNDQIEEAIIIYEKLVNEYKFGGNFPYDRLNAIYYKQNNPKEIIRICNLAIENLGHVGYLRGKELMINPEVTSAGTKEKVKKFKDRKKREEKKLKKSEQKEKEKEKQAQDQEIIEKCANDLELAQRLEEEDKIDEAMKLYETVTKAKYPEKLPYTRLCILYRKKKNYKKELTTCNKAIRNLSNKKQKEWFKERKIKVQEKIDN